MSHTHRFQPGERVRVVVEGRLSGARCEMPAQVSRVGQDGFICYLGPVDENTPGQVRAPRGLEVNAFACRFCGGWHIGTVKK